MNPLTNIKNTQKLNEQELQLGLIGKKSWHDEYKDSAWLFIGGLPYDLSEGDVICVFSQYGEPVNFNLVRDHKTGKSKGFAFLCYEDQRSTILAVDNLNGIKILGRTVRVDHVKEYKIPKEHKDDTDFVKKMREEGCAPRIETSESEVEEIIPKKVKKEKKEKKKKKKKRKDSDSEDEEEPKDKKQKFSFKTEVKKETFDERYEWDRRERDRQNERDETNGERHDIKHERKKNDRNAHYGHHRDTERENGINRQSDRSKNDRDYENRDKRDKSYSKRDNDRNRSDRDQGNRDNRYERYKDSDKHRYKDSESQRYKDSERYRDKKSDQTRNGERYKER